MNYQHTGVKPMVEGGILTAVAILFALISTYVPVIGSFVNLLWPTPIILLGVRHGYKWSILATLAAGLLIALLLHPLHAISVVVGFGLIGITLGHAFRQQYSPLKTVAAGSVASLLSKIMVIALGSAFMGINPLADHSAAMNEALTQVTELYRNMGMKESDLALIEETMKNMLALIKVIFPAGLAMAAVVDTSLNYWAAKKILRRLGHVIADFPPFSSWTMPRPVIYVLALGLVMIYWGNTKGIELLYNIGMNVQVVASMGLLIQGLALLFFLAAKYNLSRLVRGIILFMILTSGFFTQMLIFAGAFDLIFDYRRLRTPRSE